MSDRRSLPEEQGAGEEPSPREERRQFLRVLSGSVALAGLGMLDQACSEGTPTGPDDSSSSGSPSPSSSSSNSSSSSSGSSGSSSSSSSGSSSSSSSSSSGSSSSSSSSGSARFVAMARS
jgi:hypothetical protein